MLKSTKFGRASTLATEDSKVSSETESIHKSQAIVKSDIELIKRTDGTAFELYFS
jgi:hypothetical protein